ncbi:hypothetical protein DH26_gp001 [Chloriridovirus anopheles1]|uniref:Uncharacterized protein n=1 Tax=Chloriridovirus anopheles1 TaxID=1465751 RepID=W8QE04_9VIRU|nr:hypothetical protein DH26_gp001 [Anopheles minimus iridovirus]AHL67505.1 hypothetical protein AMIV_001 [Anopheles minimus iridovirus]
MNKDKYIVIYTIAVGLVVTGLCLRFGGEQFLMDYYLKNYNQEPPKNGINLLKYVGIGLYVCGWLAGAICLSRRNKNDVVLRNSIFSGILISLIWVVFEFRDSPFEYQPKLPLVACSVLLSSLIALISLKKNLKDILLIVLASVSIVVSEFFILLSNEKTGYTTALERPSLSEGGCFCSTCLTAKCR